MFEESTGSDVSRLSRAAGLTQPGHDGLVDEVRELRQRDVLEVTPTRSLAARPAA